MWEVRACRVCLSRDIRIDPPEKHQLHRLYEIVTGLKFKDTSGMPEWLCYECAASLRRCGAFRSKCRRSDAVLRSIYDANDQISEEDIERVDRSAASLTSSLSVRKLDPVCIEPDRVGEDMKGEDGSVDCMDYVEAVVKKEEELIVFSPLPVNDSLVDSDGSMKDEPLIKFKREPKKERKASRTSKKSKPVKKEKVKKRTKKEIEEEADEFYHEDNKLQRRGRKPAYNRSYYEQFATITRLSREQQLNEIEKRKETPNYINSPYKCDLCFKGFIDEAAFKNHMLRHDSVSGDYECDICRRRFRSMRILRKHIIGNHERQFACKRCSNICANPCQARMHEMWHKGKSYQCPHCNDSFLKFTSYMGHVRKKHPTQFVCEICGNAFVSEKGIRQHKHLTHNLTEAVPIAGPHCAECDVQFATDEAYKRHLACSAKHLPNNDRLKDCEECGQVFETLVALRSHMLQAHGQTGRMRSRPPKPPGQPPKPDGTFPRKCELCDTEVRSGREYWQHFRREHKEHNYPKQPGSYTCEVCGRGFKGLALLGYHLRQHTGEKPFACDECDKSFMLAEYLTRHRRVHTGEKRYPCPVCGKRYQTKSNLDKHALIHTGEKRHACEMCGKTFKVPYEKRAHVEHVHFKKPWPKRDRSGRKHRPSQDGPAVGEYM